VRDYILCVDNDEAVILALRQQLEGRLGLSVAIELARSGVEARDRMQRLAASGDSLAIVVCGSQLADGRSRGLLIELQQRQPRVAKVLLLSPRAPSPSESEIAEAGLTLYLQSPWDEGQLRLFLDGILHRVRLQRQNDSLLATLEQKRREAETLQQHIESRIRERTQALEEANRRLSQLAVTDGLTGLYNHRYLQEHLVLEVERSLRTGVPLGMLMIDVDHFRLYNNRFGHQTGDEVLRRVARLIAEHRRVNDVVARYGGEEFALLLINADQRVALRIAERLRLRVCAEPFPETRDMPGGTLTISVGVASCPANGATAAELLAAADAALFRAKNGGRNTVRVASQPEPDPQAQDSASDILPTAASGHEG
jgi:diguanylate cyclase (GGDEF)-like protein